MKILQDTKQFYNSIKRILIIAFESYKLIEKILFEQTA